MSPFDLSRPLVIHLGVGDPMRARIEDDASSRGMSLFHLELADVPNRESLIDYLAGEFMFPYEAAGFDAVVDLMMLLLVVKLLGASCGR